MAIPVLKPAPSGLEEHIVVETLRSGWWGNGPRCREFEEALAKAYAQTRRNGQLSDSSVASPVWQRVSGQAMRSSYRIDIHLHSVGGAVLWSDAGIRRRGPDTLTIDWPAAQLLVTERTKRLSL